MKLIVGLGNPGDQYKNTRHNLGFMLIDELWKKMNLADWEMNQKFKSEIVKTEGYILVKPQTYMNSSGEAVAKIAKFYKISSEEIIVIHDELDLPLGKIKIRVGGAAAGHHGVEDIIEKLGTDKFIRLRLGIGNTQAFLGEHKRSSFPAEKFVISEFGSGEKNKVKHLLKQSLKALEILIEEGVEKAQNQYN